ncbi:unnamed protein product [Phaeothamnion confervicola]
MSTASVVQQQQRPQAKTEEKPPVLTLRLSARRHVEWGQDVVDNEGMDKKSSKRCCIFHKQRKFGESSSDESDSDIDDEERARRWAQPKLGRPAPHQVYHA